MSQELLIANAAYIFFCLLFAVAVTGAALFGVKEYILSVRFHKHNSPTGDHTTTATWDNADVTTISGNITQQGWPPRQTSPRSSRHSSSSSPYRYRIRYTPAVLWEFAKPAQYSLFDVSGHRICLSSVLRTREPWPKLFFAAAGTADKHIDQVVQMLHPREHPATQSLALVRLCSIFSSEAPQDNPNHFLRGAQAAAVLAASHAVSHMVETLLGYCWAQWTYKEPRGLFTDWEPFMPTVVTHDELFRLLFQLEHSAFLTKNTETHFRVQAVMKECTKIAECGDYVGSIRHALGSAKEVGRRCFYYDLLRILVEKHHRCCVQKTTLQELLGGTGEARIQQKIQEVKRVLRVKEH